VGSTPAIRTSSRRKQGPRHAWTNKHERLSQGVVATNNEAIDVNFLLLCLLTLWLYLPGFLANTFAMMWGKWLPKTGYGPWPIDGGRRWKDGNRILGDGKTWNGLIGGSLTSGLLCVLLANLVSEGSMATVFDDGHHRGCLRPGDLSGLCLPARRQRWLLRETPSRPETRRRCLLKSAALGHLALCHHGVFARPTFPRTLRVGCRRTPLADARPRSHHPGPSPVVQSHRLQNRVERRSVLTQSRW